MKQNKSGNKMIRGIHPSKPTDLFAYLKTIMFEKSMVYQIGSITL